MVIQKLRLLLKTPVLAGVFIFFACKSYAWIDMPHPTVKYMSVKAGGGFVKEEFNSGVGNVKNTWQNFYGASLYFSDKVLLLSRLDYYYGGNKHKNYISDGNKNFYEKINLELKTPFQMIFLSHETFFYITYKKQDSGVTFKSDKYFLTNDQPIDIGSDFNLRKNSDYYAVAINTPGTENDSHDSLSRFGLFYTEENTVKKLENNGDNYLLPFTDKYGGFYYELSKPVFLKNLILKTGFSLGFGGQTTNSNVYGFKSSDIKYLKNVMYFNFKLGIKYNIKLTDNLYLNINAAFKNDSRTSLLSKSKNDINMSSGGGNSYNGLIGIEFIF